MPNGQAGCAEGAILLLGMLEDEDLNAIVERHDRVADTQRQRFAAALAFDAGRACDFVSSSGELRLNWNNWVRQIHRWLSIAFTVAVIVNIVALGRQESAVWIGLLALLPLVLLLLTGLYLFALPYANKWRGG